MFCDNFHSQVQVPFPLLNEVEGDPSPGPITSMAGCADLTMEALEIMCVNHGIYAASGTRI